MKKKINKGILITLIILPFIVLLSWLLYTKKISFNLLSKASNTPDYVVCLDPAQDTTCTVLYSGADGLYKLFHDTNVNLDANNDGTVYIKILAGKYVLTANALASAADQDREWIRLVSINKSVTIEGDGDVTLDGGSYIGGIYAQRTATIFVKNVTFSNLLNSTTYCKALTDSCPVGKAFVLDGSKITLNAVKVNTAANGSAILYNVSTLEVLAQSVLSNTGGVGVTVKDTSTLSIQNKSTVTSAGLNAVSLSSGAKLFTSSSSSAGNNEISMTKTVSGNSGYVIIAQDTASINLSMTNVKSYSGGILASGSATLKIADSVFTSSRTKLDTLISLTGTSKLTAMTKTSIKGGLYGILLNGAVEVTSIASSDISGNTNGIYITGGTTTDTKTQIKAIGSTTFTGNSYGIYIKNYADLNITSGTIFDSSTTAGIYEYADAGVRKVVVNYTEFKNNLTGITSYIKAASSTADLVIYNSKFSVTTTASQTGINVTGKSKLYVTGTKFDKEKYGIKTNTGGTIQVVNSTFSNNINGLEADVSGNMYIYGNTFSKNTTNGMLLATSISADIRNNIFDGNKTALYFTGSNTSYKSVFANNVVANSTVAGLSLSANTDVLSDYNNIYYQNVLHIKAAGTKLQTVSGYNIYYPGTSTLFKNFTPQVTSLKVNPLLDTATWKPLNTSSPVINSGNPSSSYNDKDGSRNDIGITGGPQGSDAKVIDQTGVVSALWNFDQSKNGTCSDGKDVCNSAVEGNGAVGDYNGTVKGTAPVVPTINAYGRDFDGKTGTYVDIGDKTEFETQNFTIMAVIKKEGSGKSTGNSYMILTKGCSSFEGFCFGLTGSSPVLTMRINDTGTDGKQYLSGKTVITDNQWYHVAVVVNGTAKTISLYVNGKLDTSGSFTETIYYNGASVKIGNGNNNNDLGFDGVIDYVSFSGNIASASSILASYQSLIGTVSTTCGNGKVETSNGEFCDDGNTTDSDGCSSTCKYQADLNKDGKVSINGDYVPLHNAIKSYLLNQTVPDAAYDLNKDGKATINGDYILFLKYYKYYLKSLL